MRSRTAFAPIALAAFAAVVSPAQAMPPLARRTVGTIERVNLSEKQLVIRGDERAEPLTLSFDQRTRIWRDSEAATADTLMRGQAVQVSYRLPFFGSDYASRIVLLSPAKPANRTSKPNRQDKP